MYIPDYADFFESIENGKCLLGLFCQVCVEDDVYSIINDIFTICGVLYYQI